MGSISPPGGRPLEKPGTSGLWLIVVPAAIAVVIAVTGYLRSHRTPAPPPRVVPVVSAPTVPTAVPSPIPTPSLFATEEQRLIWADQVLQAHLKAPSTYRRISGAEVWTGPTKTGRSAHIFRVEYDAQNSFGALLRGCSFVPFMENGDKVLYTTNTELIDCSMQQLLGNELLFKTIGDLQLQ